MAKEYVKYYTSEEFNKILDHFSEAVKNNQCSKLDYKTFRRLATFGKQSVVEISYDPKYGEFTVGDLKFVRSSPSFGGWFYNNDGHNFMFNAELEYYDTGTIFCSSGKKDADCNNADPVTFYIDNISTTNKISTVSNVTCATLNEYGSIDAELIKGLATVTEQNKNDMKEEDKMSNVLGKFEFGPIKNGDMIRMSVYGLCVKDKSGTYVAYDSNSGDLMNVDILNFDGSKYLYKMPVAVSEVVTGDIIMHHGTAMFVVGFSTDGAAVIAVDPVCGERKEIMPLRSPFGFNFITKVVNLLGNVFGASEATATNPFGHILPLLMLGEGNTDDLLPLMLMGGGKFDMSNPMMTYFLFSKNGNNDMLLPLMLMQAKQ